MKKALKEIRSAIADSPVLWWSLACCCWGYVRVSLYQLGMTSRASLVEMTLVALIGAIAGLAALRRNREEGWYLGVVAVALNVSAWWLRLMQVDWGAIRSSFDS
jgi:hypothetical protein